MKFGSGSSSAAHDFQQGPTALYGQIASIMRSQINAGEWRPNDDLPPIEKLSERYGVSRITIRHAIQILVGEGLLVSQRGRRVVVAARTGPGLIDTFKDVVNPMSAPEDDLRITILERTDRVLLPKDVCFIGKPKASYVRLRKVHHAGGAPYCVMDMYVDQPLFDRLPRGVEKREKLAPSIIKRKNPVIKIGRERIIVAAADLEEAQILQYPMAGPVARMTRIFCDPDLNVVYYGRFTYRGDRFGVERDRGSYVKEPWEQLRRPR